MEDGLNNPQDGEQVKGSPFQKVVEEGITWINGELHHYRSKDELAELRSRLLHNNRWVPWFPACNKYQRRDTMTSPPPDAAALLPSQPRPWDGHDGDEQREAGKKYHQMVKQKGKKMKQTNLFKKCIREPFEVRQVNVFIIANLC